MFTRNVEQIKNNIKSIAGFYQVYVFYRNGIMKCSYEKSDNS